MRVLIASCSILIYGGRKKNFFFRTCPQMSARDAYFSLNVRKSWRGARYADMSVKGMGFNGFPKFLANCF